jgi:hypothetical protein
MSQSTACHHNSLEYCPSKAFRNYMKLLAYSNTCNAVIFDQKLFSPEILI